MDFTNLRIKYLQNLTNQVALIYIKEGQLQHQRVKYSHKLFSKTKIIVTI